MSYIEENYERVRMWKWIKYTLIGYVIGSVLGILYFTLASIMPVMLFELTIEQGQNLLKYFIVTGIIVVFISISIYVFNE